MKKVDYSNFVTHVVNSAAQCVCNTTSLFFQIKCFENTPHDSEEVVSNEKCKTKERISANWVGAVD